MRAPFSFTIALALAGCGNGTAGGTGGQGNDAGASSSAPSPDAAMLADAPGVAPSGDAAGGGPPASDGASSPTDSAGAPTPGDAASTPDATGGAPDAAASVDAGAPPPLGDGGVGWDQVPAILGRIVPPTFPNLDCDVTSYGGVGDGVTDNTTAFASAIADCVAKGGGRVVAPLGAGSSATFFTGPIELKSNINLYVPAGVTIKFSTDTTKYLPAVKVSFEGSLLYNYHPLVWAHDATNVAITGGGTLDGNATTNDWYSWIALSTTDSLNLRTQNVTGVPVAQRMYGAGHYLRPSLIEFMNVTNILFDGFTAQNSPFWTIHPVMCKNITARNLHSLGNQPNTDGFDPESCVDVLLDHLTIQVGDDPIAIKSGRDVDGRTYYTPTENVVIQNCSFNSGNPGHGGAISVGSEMSAGVRNVYAQDVTFTSNGGVLAQVIYLKASVNRGGFITDFYARRLTVDSIPTFFFLNGQYSSGTVPANDPVVFTTFDNINVDTATVNSATSEGFRITGPDATKLATNIRISNVTIAQAATALRAGAAHYSGLTTTNVTVNATAFAPPASAP
jgi:polygalacturonase